MASRGTLLSVLLVAFALVVGGLVEGVSRESSSAAVRRLQAGREWQLGATAAVSPAVNCQLTCPSLLPNCCANALFPGVPPGYFCANTTADINNCGTCGNNCNAKGVTVGAACCSGNCTNILIDPNNCGFCGNKCADICYSGLCNYAG